jgi:hypothetical protein
MTESDHGEFPVGFVDPISDPTLPWVVAYTDPDPHDASACDPKDVVFAGKTESNGQQLQVARLLAPRSRIQKVVLQVAPKTLVPSAIGGINIRDYSTGPQGKGWGAPCSGARATVLLNEARVSVDVRIAEMVGYIMRANERDGYHYRKADTGAYNCRKIAGTNVWSNHAWAIAIDENWQTNPYTSPLRTDKPDWLHHRWNRYGFAWGGDYTGAKDAMHFEFMGTPAQAVAATNLARVELAGGTPIPIPPPGGDPGRLGWDLPRHHYYGNIAGPNESHGGVNTTERKFVKNIQQWLVFKGCVAGISAGRWSQTTWADGRWESATDTAMINWHNRFYGGQPKPAQCWSDDYDRLARA